MNHRAFTLIELLVVVAIIGILAAVGVVAYNGYTGAAKVNATKANHTNMVKKVSLIIQQCNLDGSVSMMSKWGNKTVFNINCYPNKFTFFSDYLINDMYNSSRWDNPYRAGQNNALQPGWCTNAASGSGGNVGFVWINGRNNMDHVTVCTCIKKPCGSSDILENKIYID